MFSFKNKNKLKLFLICIIFLVFVAWAAALYFIGTEKILDYLGVRNTYIAVFLMGLLGGSSIFSSTLYYTTIFTLANKDLNPIFLALLGGVGLTLGDSIFYLFGKGGRKISIGWFERKIKVFADWLKDKPKWLVLLITFAYIAFTPFPSDLLMLSIGLANYSYRTIVIADLFGNIVFLAILGFLGSI